MGTLVIKVKEPFEAVRTSSSASEATLTSYLASEATKNNDLDSCITRIWKLAFHSPFRPKSIGPLPSCWWRSTLCQSWLLQFQLTPHTVSRTEGPKNGIDVLGTMCCVITNQRSQLWHRVLSHLKSVESTLTQCAASSIIGGVISNLSCNLSCTSWTRWLQFLGPYGGTDKENDLRIRREQKKLLV